MNDFKIEYVNGQLTAFDIDGISQLANGIQGIQFSHEMGKNPVLTTTIAANILPSQPLPIATDDTDPMPAVESVRSAPKRKRNRNRRTQNVLA